MDELEPASTTLTDAGKWLFELKLCIGVVLLYSRLGLCVWVLCWNCWVNLCRWSMCWDLMICGFVLLWSEVLVWDGICLRGLRIDVCVMVLVDVSWEFSLEHGELVRCIEADAGQGQFGWPCSWMILRWDVCSGLGSVGVWVLEGWIRWKEMSDSEFYLQVVGVGGNWSFRVW